MKTFAALYRRLDSATSTRHKNEALREYLGLSMADPARFASAAWTLYFLAGGKPRQMISTKLLRRLLIEGSGLPEWLIDESYENVGDLAETLALLLPPAGETEELPLDAWMARLLGLKNLDDEQRYAALTAWVAALPTGERLPFFKLTTGALRIGVSKLQVVQALADATGVEPKRMAQRMMGYTQAGRTMTADDFAPLVAAADEGSNSATAGHPYPFFLAHAYQLPVADMPTRLGTVGDWLAEWKFDGIRAQYIRRAGQWWVWSRGEELVSEAFPELGELERWLPDGTALDGEIVVVRVSDQAPESDVSDIAPFASLQQRLNRKALGAKLLRDLPIAYIAYDILEYEGADQRHRPQHERRELLDTVVRGARERAAGFGLRLPLRLSPALTAPDWPALHAMREGARAIGAEGMMLKGRSAEYGVGRRKSGEAATDLWWKWKLDPMSVDAVLIYAQRGHGRRSGVFSDYTFAVWSGPPEDSVRTLVPFAKAYSGLSDEEMRAVDLIIRRTTVESFGPVNSVTPTQVFELGFEGIALSKRHKSGVATRFPRMLRWRRDKPVAEADTLENLHALIAERAEA